MDPNALINTAQFISLLAAAVTPLLVGFLSKQSWASKYRSYMLLGFSLVNGLITEWAGNQEGFDLKQAIFRAILAFITGVGAYQGILKQTVAPAVQNIGITDKQ